MCQFFSAVVLRNGDVRFCEDDSHETLINRLGLRDDDAIWEGDSVDLFLSVGEDPMPYAHLIVNPKNLLWDDWVSDGLDRQIDALVYDLYALTPAEIKIVGGAAI